MKYTNQGISNFPEFPYLLQSFLNYYGTIKNRSLNTVKGYARDIMYFLQYVVYSRKPDMYEDIKSVKIFKLDDKFFNSITQDEVFEYLFFLKKQGLGANTRSRYLSSIKCFFKYLLGHKKVIERDPIDGIDFPKTPEELPIYLTKEESIQLLNAVDRESKNYERDYCIITLFLNCGMRLSELVNIDTYDIRSDSTLTVTGKGNKQRLIYLNEASLDAINAYISVRLNANCRIIDKSALFISEQTGKRLTPRRVEQIVNENISRAGLSNMGFSAHKLRHTAATIMYQNGVDVRTLKDVLGHKNLSTTQIYTHLNREQLRMASERNPLSHIKSKR